MWTWNAFKTTRSSDADLKPPAHFLVEVCKKLKNEV